MFGSAPEKYFTGSQSFLFNWTDHGRELCWLDGTTISFHEELSAALKRLSLEGLPNFQSVALGMAVLRASWPDVRERLSRLINALKNSHFPTYAAAIQKHHRLLETWETSSQKLELLTRYAAENATSVSAKAELLASLFDRFESAYSKEEQREIAEAFAAGLPEHWVVERKGDGEPMTLPSTDEEEEQWRTRPPVFHRVLHDMLELIRVARILASGLHDYTEDDLRQKAQTGVASDIVAPEESPLEAPQSAAELLNSLQEDSELQGFARLTKHLTAAVSLPRSLSVSQELRAGGVADISNRGQLDKLLLSELAFDDLTLAVRIASNEAMYLRHETPPSPQVELRPVLIDTSLPMWGIPKLYATAMALALRIGADENLAVECFRPNGPDVEEVALTSRDDIAEQLAALAPTEHVGSALAAFERRIAESGATAEPVLITTTDPLASHTFRRALDQLALKSLWIICVERDGRLQVMQRTKQGTSVRRKIHLPLEEILANTADAMDKSVANHLPAIFGLEDFPLLLSHEARAGRIYQWGDQAVSLSDDGRLMLWLANGLGARQLCDTLPITKKRKAYLVDRADTTIEFLLCGNDPELVRITRPLSVQRTSISEHLFHVSDVKLCGDDVIVFQPQRDDSWSTIAISRETGAILARLASHEGHRRNGRCFIQGGLWTLLFRVSEVLGTDPLPKVYQGADDILELESGSFIMIRNGRLIDPMKDDEPKVDKLSALREKPEDIPRFSDYLPGSNRFAVKNRNQAFIYEDSPDGFERFRIKEAIRHSPFHGMEHHEFTAVTRKFKPRSSHWRFRRIGANKAECLQLEGKQNRQSEIRLVDSQIVLQARTDGSAIPNMATLAPDNQQIYDPTAAVANHIVAGAVSTKDFIEFTTCPGPEGVGYTLKLAEWPNGNKAWLDSRGLLHLKSENSAYPEATLVLRDGQLSGWLSTGELFGEDYHCGRNPEKHGLKRIKPAIAWDSAIKPFLGSVPWTFHYSYDTADSSSTVLPEY